MAQVGIKPYRSSCGLIVISLTERDVEVTSHGRDVQKKSRSHKRDAASSTSEALRPSPTAGSRCEFGV